MEEAKWEPNQDAETAGGDWRTHLQPEARHRIVNKIMETLKKHLPISVPGGLNELQKIAVRFEEKIYTAATSQSDYLRKISLKMLSMETKTQQTLPNPSIPFSSIENQKPVEPVLIQGLPAVSETSAFQNMSGMLSDTYDVQRQMQGRQQQQQILSQQQQQQQQLQYKLMCQQQQQQQQQQQLQYKLMCQQQQLMKMQKLQQQNSLMQPCIQQQQQSLLQGSHLQSSQQPMMQMSSGLQPGQSAILQTQSMAMQSAAQAGLPCNQLNSTQQSVQQLLQQLQQSVGRQQEPQSSMHQQPFLQQAPVSQQPNMPSQQLQQQLMGQQPSWQQNQLLGRQNSAIAIQQQHLLPVHLRLLSTQPSQQMRNQRAMSLHLGPQTNMLGLQKQQQQELLPGIVPNVLNMQGMHMLQSASMGSAAQTGHPVVGDWQEGIHQKSGYCMLPTDCKFTSPNETYWTKPSGFNSSVPDRVTWSNNQFKYGVLGNPKNSWKKIAIVNVMFLALLILAYSVSCCVLRNNRQHNYY